jgi:hypothetical protein
MALKILHITDLHDGHPKNERVLVQELAKLKELAGLSPQDQAILVVTGGIIDYPNVDLLTHTSGLLRGFQEISGIPVVVDGGCLNPAVSPLAKWFDGPYFHAFRVLDPWGFPTFAKLR